MTEIVHNIGMDNMYCEKNITYKKVREKLINNKAKLHWDNLVNTYGNLLNLCPANWDDMQDELMQTFYIKEATNDVDWFLSQPEVALIDTEADLPANIYNDNQYGIAQQDMLKVGYVKKLEA